MAKRSITFDNMRKIGLTLPGVEESTAYGAPALKVNGKLLAGVPTHRTAEPGSVFVRVGPEDLAELVASAPEIYYIPRHYVGHNTVLIRLALVDDGILRDLLGLAYKFLARHSPTAASRPKRRGDRSKS